jgi:hypothetical protein
MRNRPGYRGVPGPTAAFFAAALAIASSAFAADPAGYVPKTTEWGDPDFRGTWPLDRVADSRIPLERPAALGDRAWQTDEEFAVRVEAARKSDAAFANEVGADGTAGLAQWLESTRFGRRTSLIVAPADGRLPPMTPQGAALFKAGRMSWNDNQPVDWLTDLDAYDRCVSRGFPGTMLPAPYNDGIRVFQAPGVVAFQLEMLGTRVVPIGSDGHWPAAVRGWLGDSRGHWEGGTLVIETTNMVAGDSVSADLARRAGSPLSGRKWGILPMSAQAGAIERLTMTGPDTIAYEVTYTDPAVFTGPWTVALEWTRNESYRMHEFACHEGNVAVRDMIKATRAQRALADGPAPSAARTPPP